MLSFSSGWIPAKSGESGIVSFVIMGSSFFCGGKLLAMCGSLARCGLLVFIVMKTRSLRRIFPNPLTHARLLVGVFDLPVDRLQAVFF